MLQKYHVSHWIYAFALFIALINLQACSDSSDKSKDMPKTHVEKPMQKSIKQMQEKKIPELESNASIQKPELLTNTYVHGYADFILKNIDPSIECAQLPDLVNSVVSDFQKSLQISGEITELEVTRTVSKLDESIKPSTNCIKLN